jgi:hypothetical protein
MLKLVLLLIAMFSGINEAFAQYPIGSAELMTGKKKFQLIKNGESSPLLNSASIECEAKTSQSNPNIWLKEKSQWKGDVLQRVKGEWETIKFELSNADGKKIELTCRSHTPVGRNFGYGAIPDDQYIQKCAASGGVASREFERHPLYCRTTLSDQSLIEHFEKLGLKFSFNSRNLEDVIREKNQEEARNRQKEIDAQKVKSAK